MNLSSINLHSCLVRSTCSSKNDKKSGSGQSSSYARACSLKKCFLDLEHSRCKSEKKIAVVHYDADHIEILNCYLEHPRD